MSVTFEYAQDFVQDWLASWNEHDLDKILSHYTDDFEINSPIAANLFPESKGLIRGIEAVRKYWAAGLMRNPELEFQLLDTLYGVESVTIYYLSKSRNTRVAETIFFNEEGKIQKAIVNYSA